MSAKARRVVWTALIAAFVTAPTEWVVYRAFRAPTVERRAAEWVGAMTPAQRAETAKTIGVLPVAYRMRLFSALSDDQKAAVASALLDKYELQHPDRSPAASQYLADTRGYWRNKASRGDVWAHAEAARLAGLAHSVFTEDEASELFMLFGARNARAKEPAAERVIAWVSDTFVVRASETQLGDDCACNSNWNSCAITYDCGDLGVQCYCKHQSVMCGWPDYTGCGWFLQEQCDGACMAETQIGG